MIEENQRSSRVMAERLEELASAIQLCGYHLKAGTIAIINLGEASKELKKRAKEQNKMLGHLRRL